MLKLESRGLVFDATQKPKDQQIAFFTSLCPLRSGAILCGFQNGPAKQASTARIGICRSNDGGRTWREQDLSFDYTIGGVPGAPACAEFVEPSPGRVLLYSTWFDRSEPDRPLFDPQTEGILRSKLLLAESNDDGQTWSRFNEIDVGDLKGHSACGPPVRFADGTIGFSLESFKEYDDPSLPKHAAWLLLSDDSGRTFGRRLLLAQHPSHEVYYWDQRLCPTDERGGFVSLFWTHDRRQKKDLNVHMLRGSIRAADGDRMTVQPVETSIPGQIAAPLLLPDGRLLAFVVDRSRPGTMKLWVSHDQGRSWPADEALLIHTHDERARLSQGKENIDYAQYWEDMGKWSFGHPAIRLLPDGAVLVAHYAGTPEAMSIHSARVTVG